jgi:hypothetical protein
MALLLVACGRGAPDDECGRAYARLDRIAAAKHQPRMAAELADQSLAACRRHDRGAMGANPNGGGRVIAHPAGSQRAESSARTVVGRMSG